MDGELLEEIKERAKLVDKFIEASIPEKEPLKLHQAVRWLPRVGGKRLRPVISMLCCEAVGGKREDVLPFSVSLELLHNFTLVHDDIMDHAKERRGVETTHLRFGEPTAILAGDVLLSRAVELALEIKNPTVSGKLALMLASTTIVICEGQQLDIEMGNLQEFREKDYYELVTRKTGVLFEIACKGGTLVGGAPEELVESMGRYGMNLGVGFQIADDCLDLIGGETGKARGGDIREGKRTLPILHALQQSSPELRKTLISLLGNNNSRQKDINFACSMIQENGSIGWAMEKARENVKRAKAELAILRDSRQKEMLEMLADYSVQRRK